MSKISEQKAFEEYPLPKEETESTSFINQETFNSAKRTGYIVGYDQAFQDFLEKACDYLKRNCPSIFDTYQESGYNEIEKFKEYLEL
jgi:hypothetical protein